MCVWQHSLAITGICIVQYLHTFESNKEWSFDLTSFQSFMFIYNLYTFKRGVNYFALNLPISLSPCNLQNSTKTEVLGLFLVIALPWSGGYWLPTSTHFFSLRTTLLTSCGLGGTVNHERWAHDPKGSPGSSTRFALWKPRACLSFFWILNHRNDISWSCFWPAPFLSSSLEGANAVGKTLANAEF